MDTLLFSCPLDGCNQRIRFGEYPQMPPQGLVRRESLQSKT